MLVISRKIGESIIIADDIEVKVLWISNDGSKMKMGIRAPADISVWRNELVTQTSKDGENDVDGNR